MCRETRDTRARKRCSRLCRPMRRRKRSISASVAREMATNVTSRCARCTFMPSMWLAMKEQLGQPCSHPGAEHEVLHQQLMAALEQLGERALALGPVEDVVLLDALPRQRAALAGDLVAQSRQLL